MLKNKTAIGKSSVMPVGIVIGVLVCIGVSLVSSALLAWLISAERISENMVSYGAIIILPLSALLGSWAASSKIGRLRTQVCLITGAGYFLALLSLTALFFDSQYQGVGVATILIIVGCGLAALLGIREKKSRKSKIKKRAFC